MIAYIKNLDNLCQLRCKYHPKIKDIFKTADIYYDNNDQLYNIPISKKDNIIQTLIGLNVNVKEVRLKIYYNYITLK